MEAVQDMTNAIRQRDTRKVDHMKASCRDLLRSNANHSSLICASFTAWHKIHAYADLGLFPYSIRVSTAKMDFVHGDWTHPPSVA